MHLVRHGESTWNVQRRVQGGQHEPPLTDLGRSQAAAAATALSELLGDRAAVLLTSDQQRALETAEIIGAASGLRPMPTPLLREQGWGELEGLTTATAMAELADADLTDPGFRWAGGGESTSDVLVRVTALLGSDLVTEIPAGAELILVSHGDTMRVLVAHLLGENLADAPWRQFENGSVTTLRASSASGSVSRWRLTEDGADTVRGAAGQPAHRD
ncbi:MAG: histidine phosphatase family protein [Nakamurella sp.]